MRIPKILVVDDEDDVRERLSNIIFRKFHCEIDQAADGQQALDKLKGSKFDLVVLDIKMPGLSGIDVIKEVVKFAPETKILAISGYDSDEIATESLKAGAIDFLHKPHTLEGIELKIKALLRPHRGKRHPKKS